MTSKRMLPIYAKYFFILSNIILTCLVLILGRPIINPLLLAIFFAFLFTPFNNWLEQKLRLPNLFNAFLAILVILIIMATLFTFFYIQIVRIQAEFATFELANNKIMTNFQKFIYNYLGDIFSDLPNQLQTISEDIWKNTIPIFQGVVKVTTGIFSVTILFFISLFFFLYYRRFFTRFLFKLYNKKNHSQIKQVVIKIDKTYKKYVLGILSVILIVAVLNSFGLYLIGIKYFMLFGFFSAVLTIIPYFGILIGSVVPTIFALITKDSIWYPIGVITVFSFVQFLEGNFITPNIVGDRVNINPLIAILGLFIGGILLGITGVIMAIPILAFLKIICEEIESLKPIGFVMGQPNKTISFTSRIQKLLNKLY